MTRTLSTQSLLEFRLGVSRTEAGKTALGTGGPNMLEAYGITGLPTDEVFSGGLTQQSGRRLDGVGTPEQQPAVPESVRRQRRGSTTRGSPGRHTLEDRLRVPAHQHRGRRRPPEVRRRYLLRVSSAGRPAPPADAADLQPRRLPDRRAQHLRAGQPVRLQPAAADALRLPAGRLARDAVADGEPRASLRVRRRRSGRTTTSSPTSIRRRARCIQASDGSIYDRTLVNPDRNNFAPRVGVAYSLTDKTVLRSAYGMSYIHFNRLGGENLLSFNGPHVVPITDHAAAVAGALRAQPGADRPASARPRTGYPARPERAGELQSAQRPRQPHPAPT